MIPLKIDKLRSEWINGFHCVRAEVDGESLWFKSKDIELDCSAEGFASAALFPALVQNRDILIEANLNDTWINNVGDLQKIYSKWWDLPQISIHCNEIVPNLFKQREGVSLCFSGGVDSFYTLRSQRESAISHLLYIHGYDVPLHDNQRVENIKKTLGLIGAATSTQPIVIQTNLREHPMYRGVNWEYSHGGALASVAHLARGIGQLIISASFPYAYDNPWGTHWDTDHLWSSDCLKVSHYGAERWRTEKLLHLKDDQLVQEHLRVCWEHLNSSFNCCQCEKCIRTMLILNQCGMLKKFKTFSPEKLHRAIKNLKPLKPYYIPVYKEFLRSCRSWRLSWALKNLIRKSEVI